MSVGSKVERQAEKLGVAVHSHRVIYELVDAVKAVLEGAIEPVYEETVLGVAEVQQCFTLTLNRKDRREGMAKSTDVAGSRVSAGEASAAARVRVERDGAVLHDGRVVTLRHFRDEVKTVRRGQECGVVLHDFGGYEEGDTLTFLSLIHI